MEIDRDKRVVRITGEDAKKLTPEAILEYVQETLENAEMFLERCFPKAGEDTESWKLRVAIRGARLGVRLVAIEMENEEAGPADEFLRMTLGGGKA